MERDKSDKKDRKRKIIKRTAIGTGVVLGGVGGGILLNRLLRNRKRVDSNGAIIPEEGRDKDYLKIINLSKKLRGGINKK